LTKIHHSLVIMHDGNIGGCSENNIKCKCVMTISGGRTKQLYNCRFSATSLALRVIFSSFTVVEHIQFFHGALHLYKQLTSNHEINTNKFNGF